MHTPWLQSFSPLYWAHWYTVYLFGQRDINRMCSQKGVGFFCIHPKTSHSINAEACVLIGTFLSGMIWEQELMLLHVMG